MYQWREIRTLHLEVTSQCNAQCPMCLRNVLGGRANPHLPITSLSLEDVRAMFAPEFIVQLERLYMCGNYGDPAMGRDSLEIMRYFKSLNPALDLELFSNGSVRSEAWWAELAAVVGRARFSVDGLEDTNHLYRRGTHFPVIMRNLKAFIGAGGKAEWDFIVFRHNEHQVDEARALAQSLGVYKFNVKKTGRFFSNTRIEVKDRQEVHGPSGELEYYLEMPLNPKYLNSALKKEAQITAEFGSLKDFFGKTPIDCKVAREKSIYVSAEGYVFPCCWTANQLYPWYYEKRAAPMWKLLDSVAGGLESLSAKKHSLQDIISGDFFQRRLPESWDKQGIEAGRLFVCGKTCGKGFDAFKAQFEGSKPLQEQAPCRAPSSQGTP